MTNDAYWRERLSRSNRMDIWHEATRLISALEGFYARDLAYNVRVGRDQEEQDLLEWMDSKRPLGCKEYHDVPYQSIAFNLGWDTERRLCGPEEHPQILIDAASEVWALVRERLEDTVPDTVDVGPIQARDMKETTHDH